MVVCLREKQNKKMPWARNNFDPYNNLIRNIIHKHSKFWNESKKKTYKV